MANFVGGASLLVVLPDGALADQSDNVSVSDESILSLEASPDGNPLNRKVNFLAVGSATISAFAVASDGNTVTGTLEVVVEEAPPAPATLLSLSLVDLP